MKSVVDNLPFTPTYKFIINDTTKTITILGQSFELIDKIKIYKLLKLFLENEGVTLTKQEIFNNLWPNERFLPRTHTPRIYDLIKRIFLICGQEQFNIEKSKLGYKFIFLK